MEAALKEQSKMIVTLKKQSDEAMEYIKKKENEIEEFSVKTKPAGSYFMHRHGSL
jgi:prefoldin subunit 5